MLRRLPLALVLSLSLGSLALPARTAVAQPSQPASAPAVAPSGPSKKEAPPPPAAEKPAPPPEKAPHSASLDLSPPLPAGVTVEPRSHILTSTRGKTSLLPLEVLYQDSFILRSVDKRHELKLQASGQLDSRFYAGDSVAPHSFDVRRARIDFNSKLFGGFFTFRLQAAFEDNPYIRNLFADVRIHNAFHIRVGQMKVPFSSAWLTLDNQVDFLERSTAEPFFPFFDRGVMIWGKLLSDTITYHAGVYTGAGVDLDANKGDIDGQKDVAWRVFLQPFRNLARASWLSGLYLAGDGTWGYQSVATRRSELRGLASPDYESLVWRWRTEQTFGDNGRDRDVLAATLDQRTRFGAELHYLIGPVTVSAEWAMVNYKHIALFHDFYQGSTRLKHQPVADSNGSDFVRWGNMHNVSIQAGWFITGEHKSFESFGFTQPNPNRPIGFGTRGIGAFEVLGRFSGTFVDKSLFDVVKVPAFAAADFVDATTGKSTLAGPAPGEGATLKAAVLDGASTFYEITFGLNWMMNYHMRVMIDYTYQWAPDFDNTTDPKNPAFGIISGGNSDLNDQTLKNKQVRSEHEIGVRVIFRI